MGNPETSAPTVAVVVADGAAEPEAEDDGDEPAVAVGPAVVVLEDDVALSEEAALLGGADELVPADPAPGLVQPLRSSPAARAAAARAGVRFSRTAGPPTEAVSAGPLGRL